MKITFTKMQGIGNDYIYIDARHAMPSTDLPRLAKRLSDRHFGIGGDGIVLITRSTTCDFGMRIFNADGSEAQMCGNASRCIGKYVYERGLTDKTEITLETLSGKKVLFLHTKEGRVESVSVDMGEPTYLGKVELTIDNTPMCFEQVDMGNPHAVCFVSKKEDLSRCPEQGPKVECHSHFPNRTNVEFAFVENRHEIQMRVWERGSGETLACGTGACATAVAAIERGLTDREVTIHLLGGDLTIALLPTHHVRMTGAAAFVFDGEIYYEEGCEN